MVYKAIAHKLRGPVHIPALLIVQCRHIISHLYSFVAPIVKAGYNASLSPLFRTSNGSYLIQSKVESEPYNPPLFFDLPYPTSPCSPPLVPLTSSLFLQLAKYTPHRPLRVLHLSLKCSSPIDPHGLTFRFLLRFHFLGKAFLNHPPK